MIKNKKMTMLKLLMLTMAIFVFILPLFNYSKANSSKIIKDITKIDRDKYPGIVERVERLQAKYPNWEFEFYKTGLDWNRFIGLEYSPGRSGSPINLVSDGLKGEWVCEYRGTKKYDNGSWIAASYHAIEYAADPRTYLDESNIFAFKTVDKRSELSKAQSLIVIRNELKGASYIGHAEAIYTVSYSENVDFVDVIARILQEQGYPKPDENGVYDNLIDGAQVGNKKYYNPFNIAATGSTNPEVFASGLNHAIKNGWDTFEKGLRGGISVVKNNYSKQNSSYFEKFNSTETDYRGISNQYMQNIEAPFKEGANKKNAYKVSDPNLNSGYTFVVPLYENMQKVATSRPNSYASTPKGKPYTQPPLPSEATTTTGLNVRKGRGSTDSDIITTLPVNTPIKVRQKVANSDGYEWYSMYYNPVNGSYQNSGFVARNAVGGKEYNFDFVYTQKPTMQGKTVDYWSATNQTTATFPAKAMMTDDMNVRKSPSTSASATVLKVLDIGEHIEVLSKDVNANGYTWYKIKYDLNAAGTQFTKTGYVARHPVGSTDYSFLFLEVVGDSSSGGSSSGGSSSGGTSSGGTTTSSNTAKTTTSLNVRRGAGSLSAPIINTIPANSQIQIRKKMPNKDGYEWYLVYYNYKNGKYNNTGYIARNAVGSKTYYFNYISAPSTGGSSSSGGSSSGGTSSGGTTTSSNTAKTTTSLNVRRGAGSLSASIIKTIPKNSQIQIRKKMPNRDGYEWYLVYYNYKNGKYNNTGYIARNAVGSKTYYFNYISTPSTGGSSSGGTSSSGSTTSSNTAKTTTSLNVRKGAGSLSAPIINTIPANSQIKIRKKMPNKDGYEWYLVYYNYKNGKYNNTGYIARNAVGSKTYYFNYI